MERYKNLSGRSSVVGYEIGEDYVLVAFRTGGVYMYNYTYAGRENVEYMKYRARSGAGLSSFIQQFAYMLYDPDFSEKTVSAMSGVISSRRLGF